MEEKNQNRNQNPEQQQTPHKRRVRYKGTHPRRFEEKYKELNVDYRITCNNGNQRTLINP